MELKFALEYAKEILQEAAPVICYLCQGSGERIVVKTYFEGELVNFIKGMCPKCEGTKFEEAKNPPSQRELTMAKYILDNL